MAPFGAVISSAPVHVHCKRGETLGELLQKRCRAVCGLPADRPVIGRFLWFTTDQVAPHWWHYSCSSVQPR